jgi:hypothetical protein
MMRESERYTQQALAFGKLAELAESADERDGYLAMAGVYVRFATDAAAEENGRGSGLRRRTA